MLCVLGASAPARADAPRSYVSLGDSHTAGAQLLDSAGGPLGCLRSTQSYPNLVRRALGIASLRDASCSGAKTKHMAQAQDLALDVAPPQLDALSTETELVTLGIGLNDIGLGEDFDARYAATEPRVAAVLRAIHERAPGARVVVVGYLSMFPADGRSCLPLAASTYRALATRLEQVNALLAAQAAGNDAEFADTYSGSIGHDLCAPLGTRWVEGLIPTSLALPEHPNELGESAIARVVADTVRRPRPAPVLTDLRYVDALGTPARKLRFSYRLNRASTVTVTIRRRRPGRLVGSTCEVPTQSNRRFPACVRLAPVLRALHVDGALGLNALSVSVRRLRAPGAYQVVAFAAAAARESDPQATSFRVGAAP